MPALPVAPSTLRVALQFASSLESQPIVTRFFTTYTGSAPTAGQLDTFCGAVGTAFGSDLKAYMHEDYTLELVEAVDLTSDTSASGTAAPAVTGTLAGSTLPADVAFVVSYEILRRYRGGHPRGYWPFGDATKLATQDTWNPPFPADVQASMATFFGAVNAAGWAGAGTLTQSNVSFKKGFTVVISPTTGRARNVDTDRASAVIDTVTSYIGRAGIGSQRRRLGRLA